MKGAEGPKASIQAKRQRQPSAAAAACCCLLAAALLLPAAIIIVAACASTTATPPSIPAQLLPLRYGSLIIRIPHTTLSPTGALRCIRFALSERSVPLRTIAQAQ